MKLSLIWPLSSWGGQKWTLLLDWHHHDSWSILTLLPLASSSFRAFVIHSWCVRCSFYWLHQHWVPTVASCWSLALRECRELPSFIFIMQEASLNHLQAAARTVIESYATQESISQLHQWNEVSWLICLWHSSFVSKLHCTSTTLLCYMLMIERSSLLHNSIDFTHVRSRRWCLRVKT
jgi:hypothetical protein